MVEKKKKQVTFTVDRDDYEELLRGQFNEMCRRIPIPTGLLLSRAYYLVCLEYFGEITTQVKIDRMREFSKENGREFKEEVVLDTEGWMQHIGDLHDKRFEDRLKKLRTLERK